MSILDTRSARSGDFYGMAYSMAYMAYGMPTLYHSLQSMAPVVYHMAHGLSRGL